MPVTTVGDFGRLIGARMRSEHETLAGRWLVRLNELLPVAANEVFPSQALLDHIPQLIREIAEYLEFTDADEFAANTFVMEKARELGELRYEQRASVHQLLREYRVLGAILVSFVEQETRLLHTVAPIEVIAVLGRVAQAVGVLQQTTIETFIAKYTGRIDEQTRRLENFNRMVSHELRQPIGALQFAVKLANAADDEQARAGYQEVVERNLTRLVRLTDQLAMMSRLKPTADNTQTQHLPLELVAREVARQLGDMADRRGVEIRIVGGLPVLHVDVAAVELILVNLVANAIKYSDPAKPQRMVELRGESRPGACVIEVRDNGVGIPPEHLPRIFDRAYRAHADRDEELGTDGFGLGLAIVRDCVEDQGGQVSVESVLGEGATFTLTLPCHENQGLARAAGSPV
ncbi:MAG: HAMP domain-containing sensor histidine kinase [Vicinamibacterales bacterium]